MRAASRCAESVRSIGATTCFHARPCEAVRGWVRKLRCSDIEVDARTEFPYTMQCHAGLYISRAVDVESC